MSGAGFHVHGPHDHELEHAAQHASHATRGGGMINQIAMFTAVIATVGAIFAYMGGATQANAGLYKNNAAIKKTEAVQPVELLPVQEHEAVPGRSLARPLAARQARPLSGQGRPLREGKERNRNRCPQAGSASDRMGQAQRRADAPAPPLGPGHHGAAGVDRAGCHRPAHQEEMAGVGHVRRWAASAWRSVRWPCCTFDSPALHA